MKKIFMFAVMLFLSAQMNMLTAQQRSAKGHLFIIGGGERGSEMMRRFVELAGGTDRAKIIVIPMASGIPDTVGTEQVAELRALGVKDASFLLLKREHAFADSIVKRLDGVTGVFFSGGDQSRLTAIMNGTPLLRRIKQLYHDGAVVGGTSAGAAIMSSVMITGDELINKDSSASFVFIKKGNIKTTEGFGFLSDVIVDQHFIARKRHNRLLSLVLENPKLLGIGIDEATAIVVNPNRAFDVVGENTVMIFDATQAGNIHIDTNGNLAADNIRMHILSAGNRFDLKTKRVMIK